MSRALKRTARDRGTYNRIIELSRVVLQTYSTGQRAFVRASAAPTPCRTRDRPRASRDRPHTRARAATMRVGEDERASLIPERVEGDEGAPDASLSSSTRARACFNTPRRKLAWACVAVALASGAVCGVELKRQRDRDIACHTRTDRGMGGPGVVRLGEGLAPRRVGDFGDDAAAVPAIAIGRGRVDYSKYDRAALRELVQDNLRGKCEGSGLPVFLHIPKTGGTTIETVLGVLGIDVGYCHKRPFEFRKKFVGYEQWHTPPAAEVPNSFAIVRNPYTRAQSEFLWRVNWLDKKLFDTLRPGYDPENCEKFENHVKAAIRDVDKSELAKCYQEVKYTIEGMNECDAKIPSRLNVESHWLPQSVTAAGASRVFRFEECMGQEEGTCPRPRGEGEQPNVVSFLRSRYHPAVSMASHENEWNAAVEKPNLRACWKDMNPSVLNQFNAFYQHDIVAFGYETVTPAHAEDAPDGGYHYAPARALAPKTLGEIQAELPSGQVVQGNAGPQC